MKDQFSELAEKHKNAYGAFLSMDRREHPEPRKPSRVRHLPWIMIPFSIIALAGIILSASRTVFVFYDIALQQFGGEAGLLPTTEAITAFIVVDIFFVVSRFVVILLHYQRTKEAREIGELVKVGFFIAFSIALIANVYSSVKVLPILDPIRPVLDLAMGIAVGISVPTLAFISGDILGILAVNSLEKREASQAVYDSNLLVFDAGRERRWNAKKKEFGLSVKSNIRQETGVNTVNYNVIQPRKLSEKMERTLKWLEENPELANGESRELAPLIGVSHMTVWNAQQLLRSGYSSGEYSNGKAQ